MCVTFFDIGWALFKILLFRMLHTGSGLASDMRGALCMAQMYNLCPPCLFDNVRHY